MSVETEPLGEDGNQDLQWLSVPEVADLLGVALREVRGLLASDDLLAIRGGENQAWVIPSSFFTRNDKGAHEVVRGLRGTLIQLSDAGMDAQESMTWLHTHNEELGDLPIAVLRSGTIRAVRRATQALAW